MESKQKNKMETSTFSLNHLKVNGKLITDRKQISDLVALPFPTNPRQNTTPRNFKPLKCRKREKQICPFYIR